MSRRHSAWSPKKSSVQTQLGDGFKMQISQMMEARRRTLAPFPVAPAVIHRLMWTDTEWEAIQKLQERQVLKTVRAVSIQRVPSMYAEGIGNLGDVITIRVVMPEEVPGPFSSSVEFRNMPREVIGEVIPWVKHWSQCESERQIIVKRVSQMAETCTTWGHVHRLWPELLSLLDEGPRRKIEQAKARSPLPYGVNRWCGEFVDGTHPQWKPEAFADCTAWLAECLMLPPSPAIEGARIEY